MNTELILTADGSHTVLLPETNTTYHSRHGALQESMHVFIEAGLHEVMKEKREISIFEMGFGTGLNALLTCKEAEQHSLEIDYHSIEPNPIDLQFASALNFGSFAPLQSYGGLFEQMHKTPFGQPCSLNARFSLTRYRQRLQDFSPTRSFDLVYYDAFAPSLQPELWTTEIFSKLKSILEDGACLVTYCSKSQVRRAMQAAGLRVTKIPGPRGKREMVRAYRQ